jgi:oligoendopeptidase F
MPVKRESIKKEDRWNVEAVYKSDKIWEDEYKSLKNEINRIFDYKGILNKSAKNIKKMLDTSIDLERKLGKLYLYAHMKHDEDSKNALYKEFFGKASNLMVEYDEASSWIMPELLSIDAKVMENFMESGELDNYKFNIEKILRYKEHTLSEDEEKLISMAGKIMSVPMDAFRSLNDADLKFGFVEKNNDKKELTHGQYYLFITDKDREIRKTAFKQYHDKFGEFPSTFASLLYGKIKSDIFVSKSKKYGDCLEASLFENKIDKSVYLNLIATVRERIGSLHEYLSYRKKKMKLDEMHLYDIYVPFVEYPEIKMDFSDAKSGLYECVKILGSEYVDALKNGIENERWVDRYENENKRSGAYSTGVYDSMPYILMNFNGTLNSARTLAHEAGHSMHSYFTHKYQPPVYGKYPIFLAEVASTFNEELFNNMLIKRSNDKSMTAYLINSRLEEIRATLFRQTMFAEFELLVHELVENDTPLTFQMLNNEYRKLNEFYFGKDVVIDKEIEIEWARIPHFYYNYYVYQYATGISATFSLYKRVTGGGTKERDDYLGFLKAGCSDYPIEILKKAGVDMTTNKPVLDAIDYFDELLQQLKNIQG